MFGVQGRNSASRLGVGRAVERIRASTPFERTRGKTHAQTVASCLAVRCAECIDPCVGADGAQPAREDAALVGGAGSSLTEPQWYSSQAGELRASKLIGTSVKNTAGETIGDINEIVLGKDGKVAAVVVGVGGFLGIGEREVAVRYESLRLVGGAGQTTSATLNATKDSLKAAPEWKWSAEDRRSPTGTGTKPVQ
jgi:sporulation protein YlmC with PRC-barrel domain